MTAPPTPHGSVPPSLFGLGQATLQPSSGVTAAHDDAGRVNGEQQVDEADQQAKAILADVSSTVQNPAYFMKKFASIPGCSHGNMERFHCDSLGWAKLRAPKINKK